MAVQVRRDKKSNFVTKLEEVLPLLRERFGVTKIGIFGSTARGDDRPESDVDVLVELSPDHLTFRNFSALADFLEELYGRMLLAFQIQERSGLIAVLHMDGGFDHHPVHRN